MDTHIVYTSWMFQTQPSNTDTQSFNAFQCISFRKCLWSTLRHVASSCWGWKCWLEVFLLWFPSPFWCLPFSTSGCGSSLGKSWWNNFSLLVFRSCWKDVRKNDVRQTATTTTTTTTTATTTTTTTTTTSTATKAPLLKYANIMLWFVHLSCSQSFSKILDLEFWHVPRAQAFAPYSHDFYAGPKVCWNLTWWDFWMFGVTWWCSGSVVFYLIS